MTMLETYALTRTFGALTAVNALTISVENGEVFGLLGPNGAGKTTAIKMLTTLLPPTSGDARIAGFSITRDAAAVRRTIGYVPQALSADGTLTGYENLLIFAKLYDIGRADNLVRTYSGGMIRRLEIAQSMLHRPRLLFLDEPTVALDPAARRAVWEHIAQLRDTYGTTIFLTTHFMEEADTLCHRVAIMHHGAVAAIGTPAELKQAIGGNGATLDDVFMHYTGNTLEETVGGYRETTRARRTARRLG
jgi:ABC-2 type transport system ATP-binding protein